MLVMISIATNEMIQLMAKYPDVWFMDTTAGMYDAILCCESMYPNNIV